VRILISNTFFRGDQTYLSRFLLDLIHKDETQVNEHMIRKGIIDSVYQHFASGMRIKIDVEKSSLRKREWELDDDDESVDEDERRSILSQISSQILRPGQELTRSLHVLSKNNHKEEDSENLTVSPPILK